MAAPTPFPIPLTSKANHRNSAPDSIYEVPSRRRRFAMPNFESSIVTSVDSLHALYAQPIERIAKKQLDYVNEAGRAFIAASPFLVLATGGRQGLDCSPKGDQPGFVEVAEDGRTLFIPDRRGNNRIDGLKNLIEDPRIGLIFFVPGVNETYRVNGHGSATMQNSSDGLPSTAKSPRR